MSFDINAFKSEIESIGYAKASDFEIEIGGDILGKIGADFFLSSALAFRINAVDLPSRSLAVFNNQDYGVPYKHGGTPAYQDITITAICSPDLREREFFMRWQDLVVGDHRKGNKNADSRKVEFDYNYYDDYVAKRGVTIYKLDAAGFRTYAVDLIDVFPTLVGSLGLSWDSTDAMKLNVTLSYRYFEERSGSELGTQFRIGRDGLQIAGVGSFPFNKDIWKRRLDPKNIAKSIARRGRDILKQNGVKITGF